MITAREFILGYNKKFNKKYHWVAVYWKSPLVDRIEVRSGMFFEYAEALSFSDYFKNIYSKLEYPYIIYVDGRTVDSYAVEELAEMSW